MTSYLSSLNIKSNLDTARNENDLKKNPFFCANSFNRERIKAKSHTEAKERLL